MRIFNYYIGILGVSIICSCSNSSDKDRIIDNDIFNDRIELILKRISYLSKKGNTDSPIMDEKFSQNIHIIYQMFRKIESSNNSINLDEEYDYLKKDSLLNLDFWKKGTIDKESALIVLDCFLLEFEKSDYCNDFYSFYDVDIEFNKSTFPLGVSDSVEFVVIGKVDNYLPKYSLDGFNGEINSHFLKINTSVKGKKIVKGHVLVPKMNRMISVPFNFEYSVK